MFSEPSISKVYGMTYKDICGISWINARNYKNIAAQPMKFFSAYTWGRNAAKLLAEKIMNC